MRSLTILFCLILTAPLFTTIEGQGADFEKGYAAHERGDYRTALREWEPLAELGNADALYYLGVMYQKGQGVRQDYKTAVKWYTLAAEQDDTDAQYNLGLMYERGEGIPQDNRTAVKWYTIAARKRNAYARPKLLIFARQGNAYAQYNLGSLYAEGQGVTQDNIYAYMWLDIAASQGGRDAREKRDMVAKNMTPSQIEIAHERALECMRKKYEGC